MTKEYKTLKTEVRLPYELSYGATWTRFFEGLRNKKIYGSKCKKCGRVLVPARTFCPRCFVDTDEWIEVSQGGTVSSYVYVNMAYFGQPVQPPFIASLIKLEGTDVNFLHLIAGFDLQNFDHVEKTMRKNMKVSAVWNNDRTGNIFDIKYFEPV